MNETTCLWVGIDVGKTSHHACAVDATGTTVWTQKIGNDQRELEALITRATTATSGEGPVLWAIDLTCSKAALLIGVLLAARQQVVYVPGIVVNRMASTFRGEGKTDAKDARVIAETARQRPGLAAVTADEDLIAELRALTAYRTDLMDDWVRGINRVRELLTSIFPALESAFDYSSRAPLILLTGMCTPAEIRTAKRSGILKYLRKHHASPRTTDTIAEKAWRAAQSQTITLPGEAGTAKLIKQLATRLLNLHRDIKDTDKTITETFRQHASAHIIESIPGMGPQLGAEFLVATGGDMAAFADAGRLASYAGLVPVPRDSGRVSGNMHRAKRYNRRLRRTFYMAAFASIRLDGPSRDFYQRKRSENKRHTQAILALARRRVDVLWALLRDNRTWQPTPPGTAIKASAAA